MLKTVQAIFIRQVTKGDFWCVERHPSKAPVGGGGQTYFDIPLSDVSLPVGELWDFLDASIPTDQNPAWPSKTIRVGTIGNSSEAVDLTFAPRGGNNSRYKISNQARQYGGNNRHPAWTAANGFPKAPDDARDKNDPRIPDVSQCKIYIVKTTDDEFYAGFVDAAAMPVDWPQGLGLEDLFNPRVSSKVTNYSQVGGGSVSPLVARILEAWTRGKNVLLYGPPGTGKTRAMQDVWKLLAGETALQGVALDPDNKNAPFEKVELDLPLTTPVRREWVTFHQNFSYENFVLALRPDAAEGGGIKLVPRAGVLLDAAMSVDLNLPNATPCGSAVLCIDEINRGNVSRIFGEFITFMEDDYRAGQGTAALPVPLPSIKSANGKTEPIERLQEPPVELPSPWYFPDDVYILASMNSVDRAVAPLDTALARRFERIEVGPDLKFLADHLGIADNNTLLRRFASTEAVEDDIEDDVEQDEAEDETTETTTPAELTAAEVAWLLLYRLNYELAATLGSDFELGHSYMMRVKDGGDEDERFRNLARAWDGSLYPQLRERFASRPDEFERLLRLEGATKTYLFRKRPAPAQSSTRARGVWDFKPLSDPAHPLDDVKYTLRRLAGADS